MSVVSFLKVKHILTPTEEFKNISLVYNASIRKEIKYATILGGAFAPPNFIFMKGFRNIPIVIYDKHKESQLWSR